MPRPSSLLAAGLFAAGAVSAAAFAQVGPFTPLGATSASPLPKEDRQREALDRARAQRVPDTVAVAAPAQAPAIRLGSCLAAIDGDADAAAETAKAWLNTATGAARADAAQCLGAAQVAHGDFAAARATFVMARDAAGAADHASRARLGAMAGNAALAAGDPANALTALDMARVDAGQMDKALASGIALDRVRALVALKRDDAAAAALAEVRTIDPADAEAWLLSATLSRRTDKLTQAQTQIERAAALLPASGGAAEAGTDIGPQIGLEAGVIAMLSGRADAARRSWQSVIATAPQSPSATTAQGYLAQLGTRPTAALTSNARPRIDGAAKETDR